MVLTSAIQKYLFAYICDIIVFIYFIDFFVCFILFYFIYKLIDNSRYGKKGRIKNNDLEQ